MHGQARKGNADAERNKRNMIPISETSERAALSLMSIDPDILPQIAWHEDLFAFGQNKLIFQALNRAYQKTGEANPILAVADLESRGLLDEAGGKDGVLETLKTIYLAPGKVCVETAQEYHKQLQRAKSYRDALSIWEDNEQDIRRMKANISDIAEQLHATIPDAKQAKSVKEHLLEYLDELENNTPVEKFPLGMEKLDRYIGGGVKRGEMMVVGAQTSGGKSILLYQAALNALRDGKSVVIFSLEMPARAILQRMACNLIGKQIVPVRDLEAVMVWRDVAQATDIASAVNQLMKMPLTIRDDLSDVAEIDAEARRLASLGKADVIVVDYLQIVDMPKADNREQAVSELARRLKLTANKSKSAVFTASQLNDDGAVRESRAIGHHTDYLLIISHPDDRKPSVTGRKVEKQPTSRIRIDKNRNGQRDVYVPVKMLGAISRFQELQDEN